MTQRGGREGQHEAEEVAPARRGIEQRDRRTQVDRSLKVEQDVGPVEQVKERAERPGEDVDAQEDAPPEPQVGRAHAEPETGVPSAALLRKVVHVERRLLEHEAVAPFDAHAMSSDLDLGGMRAEDRRGMCARSEEMNTQASARAHPITPNGHGSKGKGSDKQGWGKGARCWEVDGGVKAGRLSRAWRRRCPQ